MNYTGDPIVYAHANRSRFVAVIAYRKGFGATPVFLRSGGTIPVVNLLQEILGIPTVLMGFALPDDRMHAPNEKFHLLNSYNGNKTSIWFLAEVGARQKLKTELTQKQTDYTMAWRDFHAERNCL